jgi:hypothetical protein
VKESVVLLTVSTILVATVFVAHKVYNRDLVPRQKPTASPDGYDDPRLKEIDQLISQYQRSDISRQRVLRVPLMLRLSDYPREDLPADIAAFYDYLERGEL